MLRGDVEPHSNDVRKRKMTLKLHSRTPSLLQDSTSLPATAESGMNETSVIPSTIVERAVYLANENRSWFTNGAGW